MITKIPESWKRFEIGEVAYVVGGGTPPSQDATNFSTHDGIPWITPADLTGYKKIYIKRGARSLTEKGFSSCSAIKIPAGSVLFSSRAPVGYVAIASNEVTTNQGFKSFLLPDGVDSRFVYFYMRYIKPIAEAMATGTTFRELSGAAAARLPMILAPFNEQKRIADKLVSLLSRVDVCLAHLDRVPVILKRFRKAVLSAATTGQLTADWRQKNEVSGEWSNQAIGDAAFVTKLAGFEYTKFINYRIGGDLRVIKAENAGKLGFKFTDFSTVFSGEVEMLTRTKLREGDVLMVFVGAGTGQVARVPSGDNWFLGPNIAMIRTNPDILNAAYLEHYCRSPKGCDEILKYTKSVAQPSLSMKTIRQIQISLPTLKEQNEIVCRLETLLALAGYLEARYTTARKQVERLTPSLLAKAFRGELVPQDPNDEPAEKLLERIRSTKLVSAAGRRTLAPRATLPNKNPARLEPVEPRSRISQTPPVTTRNIPEAILAAMNSGREYTRADILNSTGIRESDWLWAIRQLRNEGKVVQVGDKRGAKYHKPT